MVVLISCLIDSLWRLRGVKLYFDLPPSQYVLTHASKQEVRMEAQAKFGSERFEMRGWYILTVECAVDLINDEIIMMAFP
jgi:hypothetical protein